MLKFACETHMRSQSKLYVLGTVILNRIEYFKIRVANTCVEITIGIARRIHNYLCNTNSDYWRRGANP